MSSNFSGFSRYSLSGTLSDGTLIVNQDLRVQNGTNAHFTLNNTPAVTPEPGSVALLVALGATGTGFLSRRRRRRSQN